MCCGFWSGLWRHAISADLFSMHAFSCDVWLRVLLFQRTFCAPRPTMSGIQGRICRPRQSARAAEWPTPPQEKEQCVRTHTSLPPSYTIHMSDEIQKKTQTYAEKVRQEWRGHTRGPPFVWAYSGLIQSLQQEGNTLGTRTAQGLSTYWDRLEPLQPKPTLRRGPILQSHLGSSAAFPLLFSSLHLMYVRLWEPSNRWTADLLRVSSCPCTPLDGYTSRVVTCFAYEFLGCLAALVARCLQGEHPSAELRPGRHPLVRDLQLLRRGAFAQEDHPVHSRTVK